MAKVKIQGNAAGTGVLTILSPDSDTDRTITLPDATGTLLTSDGSASSLTAIPAANITGTLPAIDGSALTNLPSTFAGLSDTTISASNPTVSTNPSAVGDIWINKTTGDWYVCTSISSGDNVWVNVGGKSGNIS